MGGMPGSDQMMQGRGIVAGFQLLAQAAVTEQLGNFGQDFKVFLRGGFRHQQKNQQPYRLFIRCIKANRRFKLENCRHRGFQALDAAVGNGNAMAQTGRSETLAGKKAVGDQGTIEAMKILEQKPGFFKRALLARRFNADEDLGGGQNLRKTVHNNL